MKQSIPALMFLLGLVIVPVVITAAIGFSALYYAEGGVLIGRGEAVSAAANAGANGDSGAQVVHCSYFAGTHFVERTVAAGAHGYRGKNRCPLWIDLSSS
ncbi:MAG: hypothetical protein ACR2Q4_00470 [Geminicoccaceae bacterium]